jgi:hypothetical protein
MANVSIFFIVLSYFGCKGTKKNAYMQIKKNKQKVYIYIVYI